MALIVYDNDIEWKHFPRYLPFVRGIHRSPMYSLHKGQWRGALVFLFYLRLNKRWTKNQDDDDFRRYRAHYDVTVMDSTMANMGKYIKWIE